MADQPDTRTRLLDAAEAIVRMRGVTALTLDAAAQAAQVSKGGLLYHFATKEALLDALLRRLSAFLAEDFQASVAAQPEGAGRVARAVLEWGLGQSPADIAERCDRIAAVFLVCFHHDPALLAPMREQIAHIRAAIENDGLPPGNGAAIMAACDGLFMARIFSLYTLTAPERDAIHAALATLIAP